MSLLNSLHLMMSLALSGGVDAGKVEEMHTLSLMSTSDGKTGETCTNPIFCWTLHLICWHPWASFEFSSLEQLFQ